jgi:uncharacterized protein with von Willebrand factor type A (vWA) domain
MIQASGTSGDSVFNNFLFTLKDAGIPVSPTAFLKLHQALGLGLVSSLNDFYIAARTTLVKSERYFDLFDQVFAYYFKGADLPDGKGLELDEMMRAMLAELLKDPIAAANALGLDPAKVSGMTPEELMQYFMDR